MDENCGEELIFWIQLKYLFKDYPEHRPLGCGSIEECREFLSCNRLVGQFDLSIQNYLNDLMICNEDSVPADLVGQAIEIAAARLRCFTEREEGGNPEYEMLAKVVVCLLKFRMQLYGSLQVTGNPVYVKLKK
jgi:hypothetical protein